jgi:F-type H+-transporting ATPase subunit b
MIVLPLLLHKQIPNKVVAAAKVMFIALAGDSIQLVPDGTLFIHILLIILMVFILNFTLFRPINYILKQREEQTLGRSNETRVILNNIETNLKEYEQSLRKARTQGYSVLESYRTEALQHRQNLLSSLQEELQALTTKEKELIRTQIGQARLILQEDSHRVALEISKQVLHHSQ